MLLELSTHQHTPKHLSMSHNRKARCLDILLKIKSLLLKRTTIGFLFKKIVPTTFNGEALPKSYIFSVKFYYSIFFSLKIRRELLYASSHHMVPLFVPTPSHAKPLAIHSVYHYYRVYVVEDKTQNILF